MKRTALAISLAVILAAGSRARAGLHYSGESFADLPSQWRGYLLDQRLLRNLAVRPGPGVPPNPNRERYEQAAADLEEAAGKRALTADELADLGAVYVRLGQADRAVELLRSAQRQHPQHFRIAANLGTAWQAQGELGQAADSLQQAVELAPADRKRAEEFHLRLVRLRHREPAGSQAVDDLFGVRYVGDKGDFEPGQLASKEREKLPKDAVTMAQQLGLWLPADPRILWQLGELANAFGDVQSAAAMLDGCVTEYRLSHADLRQRRQLVRTAADERARQGGAAARTEHDSHVGGVPARSRRPLANKLDLTALPPIRPTGLNAMPWAVLNDTSMDRDFRPTFAPYLRELEGKQVSLTGFLQPLADELEAGSFMLIEYPIGCWYCEIPPVQGIVLVELPPGKTVAYNRNLVKITGKLLLNATDPEGFLYTIGQATVAEAD